MKEQIWGPGCCTRDYLTRSEKVVFVLLFYVFGLFWPTYGSNYSSSLTGGQTFGRASCTHPVLIGVDNYMYVVSLRRRNHGLDFRYVESC